MNDVTDGDRAMRDVFKIDEDQVRGHVDHVVRETVQGTLNQMLDTEADALNGAYLP